MQQCRESYALELVCMHVLVITEASQSLFGPVHFMLVTKTARAVVCLDVSSVDKIICILVKCKSLWGERDCLLSVIIYAACNTECLHAAHTRCHANFAHAYIFCSSTLITLRSGKEMDQSGCGTLLKIHCGPAGSLLRGSIPT